MFIIYSAKNFIESARLIKLKLTLVKFNKELLFDMNIIILNL